ncbi:MAG: acyl-CoA reductase [Flavobacteriales bacterium]|nr:acyl-CoA reductase [Flavobacteriales bacterium]
MNLDQRIGAFVELGNWLREKVVVWEQSNDDSDDEFSHNMRLAGVQNPWFDRKSLSTCFKAWSESLNKDSLNKWLEPYQETIKNRKKAVSVGIVAAGNIPLVCFHDFLSILLSGNSCRIKMAKSDEVLLPYITKQLIAIEPAFKDLIVFAEYQLQGFDAVIATGSNNSARYFDLYFGKYPNVIRKNRNSIAVIDGSETSEEYAALGQDIFQYFGLGCRNVSKLLVPENYILDRFYEGIYAFADIVNHNKYGNNYDYNRTIYLMSVVDFLDNGFLLLKEDEAISSPIAVLYYERYKDEKHLQEILARHGDDVQCIVSKQEQGSQSVRLGDAQNPKLNDYADGVNTLDFLCNL